MAPPELTIARSVRDGLLDHARRQAPAEAVALLTGARPNVVIDFIALTNLVSGHGFIVHPRDQFEALMTMRRRGQVLVATFHSHPDGGANPSEADLRFLGRWPCPHIIAAIPTAGGRPERLAAFAIGADGWRDVRLRVTA